MASPPRVAIVGGGISGSLCALVLRSRGAIPVIFDKGKHSGGGRFGQRRRKDSLGDTGAQFLTVSNESTQFAQAVNILTQHQLVAPWQGRFGLLGSRGGGFLPREIIGATAVNRRPQEESAPSFSNDGDNFCNFIGRTSASPLFVGTPAMNNVCAELCSLAEISVRNQMLVKNVCLDQSKGTWSISGESQNSVGEEVSESGFQAVVVASHDPSFGAKVVQQLVATATDPEHEQVAQRLSSVASGLNELRAKHTAPVFALSATFPAGSLSAILPFDAVSCPTSPHLQLLVREASKPGRAEVQSCGGELWTAISTSSFARQLLQKHKDLSHAADDLAKEFLNLINPVFIGGGKLPSPVNVSAKCWKAGFTTKSLGLQEECIGLEPWRLAICGDFIRDHPSPIEAAATSGMLAGERVAGWFENSKGE